MAKDVENDEIEFIDDNAPGDGKLEKLKRELKECKREKEEYLQGWQRAKADFINAERQALERAQTRSEGALAGVLQELLHIADSFEKAFAESPPDSGWASGIRNIKDMFASLLSSYGVKPIETAGKMFDPNYHEAVAMEEVEDPNLDEHILEEIQKGYMRNATVLRPSRVKVAKLKE